MDFMPSCTVPTFSKIEVTLQATQPDMLVICQDSGSAVATVPSSMRPLRQQPHRERRVATRNIGVDQRQHQRHSRVISRFWRGRRR